MKRSGCKVSTNNVKKSRKKWRSAIKKVIHVNGFISCVRKSSSTVLDIIDYFNDASDDTVKNVFSNVEEIFPQAINEDTESYIMYLELLDEAICNGKLNFDSLTTPHSTDSNLRNGSKKGISTNAVAGTTITQQNTKQNHDINSRITKGSERHTNQLNLDKMTKNHISHNTNTTWYCGNCFELKGIKTRIKINNTNRNYRCRKCNYLQPIKKIVCNDSLPSIENGGIANDCTTMHSSLNSGSIDGATISSNNTFELQPQFLDGTISRTQTFSNDPFKLTCNNRSQEFPGEVKGDISINGNLNKLDTDQDEETDLLPDLVERPCTIRGVSWEIDIDPLWANDSTNNESDTGSSKSSVSSKISIRNQVFRDTNDLELANFVGENIHSLRDSVVSAKTCWFCPNIMCGKEIDLWDTSNARCGNLLQDSNNVCNYLKPIKQSVLTVKKFPCNYPGCNKWFKHKSDLKVHANVHTGKKPFPCQYQTKGCTASFKSISNRNHHQNMYCKFGPKNRKHKCDRCSKSFKRKEDLEDHEYNIHTKKEGDPQKYPCPHEMCKKSYPNGYSSKGNLNKHIRKEHPS